MFQGKFPDMIEFRVPTLMKRRGLNAHQLAIQSGGRLSVKTAWRLANGHSRMLTLQQIGALCEILEVTPGRLFRLAPQRRNPRSSRKAS